MARDGHFPTIFHRERSELVRISTVAPPGKMALTLDIDLARQALGGESPHPLSLGLCICVFPSRIPRNFLVGFRD